MEKAPQHGEASGAVEGGGVDILTEGRELLRIVGRLGQSKQHPLQDFPRGLAK